MFRIVGGALFGWLLGIAGAHAQDVDLAKARPVSVLPADPSNFAFRDAINTDTKGSFVITGTRNGKPVFRADNPKGSTNQYGVNARWMNARPIRKGDVLLVRFAARALKARQESGEAEGLLTFEGQGERQLTQAFSVGPDWTQINAPFLATRDFAAGEAATLIAFSNLEQTIEFADLDVQNFEDRLTLAALPTTKFTYAGREPDAGWRKAALNRIETIRTAPLIIRVVDASGRPIKGARVEAAMTRSAFLWGSEVDAERIVEKSANADRYRREITTLFDTAVIGNGLKWPRWAQPEYRQRAVEALDWLNAQGKRVKGHNLAWTAWKFSPSFIAKDPAKQAQIAALNDAHIRDVLVATKGKLIGWDVVNEPIHETDYFEFMPREHVAEWFKMARASDPSLQLTLNEYGMLNRSSSPLMIGQMLDFSRMLRANGAKVDILGVQGHVGQTPRAPVSVLSDLDLLAADGQKVQITEFDFNTTDEALQADYTRDFLIALYSHKAVTGFIMWGFWEASQWKPAAAMFRSDWSEKPNLQVWRDLVLNRWKTRTVQMTGSNGELKTRGHLGRYHIVISVGKKRVTTDLELVHGAKPTVVTM